MYGEGRSAGVIVIWTKEDSMQKQCTNSACRRSFSVSSTHGVCPWCGKKYPRLGVARPKHVQSLVLSSYSGNKYHVVRAVRRLTGIDIFQSKKLVESLREHAPIRVDIDRPENLDEAEKLLQTGRAHYRFYGSRKRTH